MNKVVSAVVSWVQLALWIFASVGFLLKGRLPHPFAELVGSPFFVLALIVFGATTSALAIYWRKQRGPFIFRMSALTMISDHTFLNQDVAVDGHLYNHCNFENVRLVYDGLGDFSFKNSGFSGRIILRSNNPAIEKAWVIRNLFLNLPFHGSLGLDGRPLQGFEPIPTSKEDSETRSTPASVSFEKKGTDAP